MARSLLFKDEDVSRDARGHRRTSEEWRARPRLRTARDKAIPGESDVVDYIIVGGGSAGCATAGRLSEDASTSVLLFEQGPRDTNPYIHMLATYFKTAKGNLLTRYRLQPQRQQNMATPEMVQGRVLSGGSSVNAIGVHARMPQRLRQLGRDGLRWLGLRRRAAVVQKGRRQRTLRGRSAWARRAARCIGSALHALSDKGLVARVPGDGHQLQPGLQLGQTGRLRPVSNDDSRRQAMQAPRPRI